MKKTITTLSIVGALLLAFVGGAYAASNWINFEGEQSIETTKSNINELLTMIDDLNVDLDDSEGSYDELVDYYEKLIEELQDQFNEQLELVTNAKDKEIQELQREIQDLLEKINNFDDNSDYVKHLETELQEANDLIKGLEEYSTDALNELKD